MSKLLRTRIPNDVLLADNNAFLALKTIPGYTPSNTDYGLETLTTLHQRVLTTREAELHAQHSLAAARDAALEARREFHDAMLGAKDQVKAFFGADSDEFAALGLKKKSERRVRLRRRSAAG